MGFGHDDLDDYYACQNSYDTDCGYRGNFKISRNLIGDIYVPIGTQSPDITSFPMTKKAKSCNILYWLWVGIAILKKSIYVYFFVGVD